MRDAQWRAVEFFNTYNGKLYDSTQEPQLSLSSANPRLERDYAQSVPVTVTNLSDQSVLYYLCAENPYSDIYLNFVSCGSELQPITILPDETQTISMSVFTQNAAQESYTIPVTAFVAYGEEYYANAMQDVTFTCHIPNVSMRFTQGDIEAATLKTEWPIENTGEAITDLTLSLDGTAIFARKKVYLSLRMTLSRAKQQNESPPIVRKRRILLFSITGAKNASGAYTEKDFAYG